MAGINEKTIVSTLLANDINASKVCELMSQHFDELIYEYKSYGGTQERHIKYWQKMITELNTAKHMLEIIEETFEPSFETQTLVASVLK